MSDLQKLIKRCNDMDITEQLNIFDDAFLPSRAAAELAALHGEIERLRELVLRAQNDMAAIESRCLTKNREKARSLKFIPILNIASKWATHNRASVLRDAAEAYAAKEAAVEKARDELGNPEGWITYAEQGAGWRDALKGAVKRMREALAALEEK